MSSDFRRPDFIVVHGMLDCAEGELHLFDHRGRLVGLLRGVQLVSPAEGRKGDCPSSGQDAPPEGQPPAGGEQAREAKP